MNRDQKGMQRVEINMADNIKVFPKDYPPELLRFLSEEEFETLIEDENKKFQPYTEVHGAFMKGPCGLCCNETTRQWYFKDPVMLGCSVVCAPCATLPVMMRAQVHLNEVFNECETDAKEYNKKFNQKNREANNGNNSLFLSLKKKAIGIAGFGGNPTNPMEIPSSTLVVGYANVVTTAGTVSVKSQDVHG